MKRIIWIAIAVDVIFSVLLFLRFLGELPDLKYMYELAYYDKSNGTTINSLYQRTYFNFGFDVMLLLTNIAFLVILLRKIKNSKESADAGSKRALGSLNGKIVVSKDFNEPLDDLKEYM